MKKLLAILLMCAAGIANAASYYISDCQSGAAGDCEVGLSGNNGTSPSTPKVTYAQITSAYTIASGDTIFWAKGGAWTSVAITNGLTNSASFVSGVVTHDWYDHPSFSSSARPKLGQSGSSNLFTQSGRGYVIKNLELIGNAFAGRGYSVSNTGSYAKLENMDIHGFGGGIGGDTFGEQYCSYFWITRNENGYSDIHNNGDGYLGDCNHLLIAGGTRLRDNSPNTGNGRHNFYATGATGFDGGNKNIVLRDSIIYGQGNQDNTAASGDCITSSITAHGLNTGIVYENNVIYEDVAIGNGCTLAEMTNADAENNEGMIDCAIRGNLLVVKEAVASATIGVIGTNATVGCVIENNVIILLGSSNYNYTGIGVNQGAAADRTSSRVIIRNNSLYLGRGMDSDSVGIRVRGTWSGARIVGNLCYQNTSSFSLCFAGDAMSDFSDYSEWDYNLYYKAGASGEYSNFATTLAAAQALGFDTNGVSGNPVLVTVPSSANCATVPHVNCTMQIQTTSPAKNACGATSTLSTGCARLAYQGYPAVGTRDIGAYEFGSNP